jgi:hypothetical protein
VERIAPGEDLYHSNINPNGMSLDNKNINTKTANNLNPKINNQKTNKSNFTSHGRSPEQISQVISAYASQNIIGDNPQNNKIGADLIIGQYKGSTPSQK